ncbi:D-beta-hydroxybutyrate dehydrogenase, mitochondrial isoform X17 [Canis lupus familiaris]|uniref:D-beta-hydroxybutyrate dehydrogenase, mitochondrial isoform X17 n=1 Tax=Canis lupus familiaris TaxID=9615 RepID=UPI0018F3A321|nr:D-beta-hydroxybutyrate dehydrogenase, mitochondrial isoform X17 [Canis lupus familiaris]
MKKSWRSRCSVPWHRLSCGQVLITDQLLNIPVEMMDGQADINLRSSLPGACLPGACFHLMARRFQGCQHWERLSLAREALILSHRTAASWASAGKPVRMPWGALLWAKDAPAALFEEEVPSPEPTTRRLTIPPLVATMLTAHLFRPLSQLPGKSLRFYDRGNGTRPEPLGRGAPLLPGSRRAFSNEVGSKAVLVTGCDSGFGFSLAKHLHSKGFLVFAGCLMKIAVPWANARTWLQQMSLFSYINNCSLSTGSSALTDNLTSRVHFSAPPPPIVLLGIFTYLLPVFFSTHRDWALGPTTLFFVLSFIKYLLSTYKSQQCSPLEVQHVPIQ